MSFFLLEPLTGLEQGSVHHLTPTPTSMGSRMREGTAAYLSAQDDMWATKNSRLSCSGPLSQDPQEKHRAQSSFLQVPSLTLLCGQQFWGRGGDVKPWVSLRWIRQTSESRINWGTPPSLSVSTWNCKGTTRNKVKASRKKDRLGLKSIWHDSQGGSPWAPNVKVSFLALQLTILWHCGQKKQGMKVDLDS